MAELPHKREPTSAGAGPEGRFAFAPALSPRASRASQRLTRRSHWALVGLLGGDPPALAMGFVGCSAPPREPGERGGVSCHHTGRVRIRKIALGPLVIRKLCKSAFFKTRHRTTACRVCSLSLVSVIHPDHPSCSSILFPNLGQTAVLAYCEKNHLTFEIRRNLHQQRVCTQRPKL